MISNSEWNIKAAADFSGVRPAHQLAGSRDNLVLSDVIIKATCTKSKRQETSSQFWRGAVSTTELLRCPGSDLGQWRRVPR